MANHIESIWARRSVTQEPNGHLANRLLAKFAGPCAQGVLDTVIVPCPMSLGCSGLIDSIVLISRIIDSYEPQPVKECPPTGYLPFCRCGCTMKIIRVGDLASNPVIGVRLFRLPFSLKCVWTRMPAMKFARQAKFPVRIDMTRSGIQ